MVYREPVANYGVIGEGFIYIFEQIYLGNKTVDDIDWVKQILESKVTAEFGEKLMQALKSVTDKTDDKAVLKIITEFFLNKKK